jgi:hypothetical protein
MPLVYEINARCWLRELTRRADRNVSLARVPDSEFAEWLRLGFTHIWLMGVWTSGSRSRAVALAVDDLQRAYGCDLQELRQADVLGSPYAIARYEVPDELGGERGLREFRRKLHQHGLKLLLDFVPNHMGLDHSWLREHPELFVQSAGEHPGFFEQETVSGRHWIAHGKDPYFPPWSDTAQLDYRNPETRAAMQRQLFGIAERCDGVRCDMAMLILNEVMGKTWAQFPSVKRRRRGDEAQNEKHLEIPDAVSCEAELEFWPDAIAATRRAHPGFLFIAEVYWGLEARLQSMGFDFTYNKELYDDLIRRDISSVRNRLQNSKASFLSACVHFLENHDEPRIASLLSLEEHRAAAFLLLSLPGMRLLHEGQLTGARHRVPVQLNCRPVEPEHAELRQMYEQLITTIQNSSVGKGSFIVLNTTELSPGNPTAQNIVAILWQETNRQGYLSAVNLAPCRSQAFILFPTEQQAGAGCTVRDLLGRGESKVWPVDSGSLGIVLELAEHEGRLLRIDFEV